MKNGIQNVLENIGSTGCYFLCLLKQAGYKENDVIDMYEKCLSRGLIDNECTVLDGTKLASFLFKRPIACTIEERKPKDVLFYIECWYNPRTGYTHFRLPKWDSLKNSVTVKEGYIKNYRSFRPIS